MNLGILLALSAALAYGAADFIGGVGSRRHSSWQVVLVGQAAGALVMFSAGLWLPAPQSPARGGDRSSERVKEAPSRPNHMP